MAVLDDGDLGWGVCDECWLQINFGTHTSHSIMSSWHDSGPCRRISWGFLGRK
jgi:hypothetical protein